jgi:hypothetical protein
LEICKSCVSHSPNNSVTIVGSGIDVRTDLKLGVAPTGDLDDHVEDALLGIGVEGDIVESRNGDTVLLNVDAMLQGVGSSHLADRVLGGHCGRWFGCLEN